MELIDLAKWLAGAVITVGLIQWIKAVFMSGFKRELPGWLLVLVMPIVSLAVGFASGEQGLWTALGIWAVAQVGYEGILKGIIKKVGG